MKTVLSNLEKEVNSDSNSFTKSNPSSSECNDSIFSSNIIDTKSQELLKEINERTVKVVLTRLTQDEIDFYSKKKKIYFKKSTSALSKTVPLKMKLRKRTK